MLPNPTARSAILTLVTIDRRRILGVVLLVRQLQLLAVVVLLAVALLLVAAIVFGAPEAHAQPT